MMKGKIVLSLNNAMFALGAARLRLKQIDFPDSHVADDYADQLKDISNQIDAVAKKIWGNDEYERHEAQAAQFSSIAKETGEAAIISEQTTTVKPTKMFVPLTDKSQGILAKLDSIAERPTDAAFKKVDKLFFLNEWEGIKSIEPAEIIGKTTLITFNVNTRQLAKYTAGRDDNLDLMGLDVKGSTIKNLDPDIHMSYSKTIRHPEDMIVHISRSDNSNATYKLAKINAVPKPLTGRINKHTLLLKAW